MSRASSLTSPNRITAAVRARNAAGQGAFVPFLVLGDPDFETSLMLARTLVEAGADALELGFAFSDPPADGPVIQRADERALAAGMTPARAFDLIEALQKTHAIPVSLLVYYNLVLQFGMGSRSRPQPERFPDRPIDAFYRRAAAVGVDAILVADLPPEHAQEAVEAAGAHGVAPVFLASELSPPERLKRIAAVADGYIYALARVGVTGQGLEATDSEKRGRELGLQSPAPPQPATQSYQRYGEESARRKAANGGRDRGRSPSQSLPGPGQADVDPNLSAALDRMRAATDLPLLAGFGIGGPAQAIAARRAGADGVIVGSAIVRRVAKHLDDRDAMRDAVADIARTLAAAAHCKLDAHSSEPSGVIPC